MRIKKTEGCNMNKNAKPCKICGTLTGAQFGYCQANKECNNANLREYRKTKRGKSNQKVQSRKAVQKRYSSIENWVSVKFPQWRYRVKKRDIEFSIVLADVSLSDRCAVTGLKFDLGVGNGQVGEHNEKSPSLDRINADLGYIPGNVRLVVNTFNKAKGMVEHSKYRQRLIVGLLADMDNWSKEVYNDE